MTSTENSRSCRSMILRTLLIIGIALPFVLYAGYAFFFYQVQREALFPGQHRLIQVQNAADFPGLVEARFTTSQGELAGFAWYLEPPESSHPAPAVIIGHGNGEIADDWVGHAMPLRDRGFGVLIIGYPGFGHAPGEPTRDNIVEAAVAGYDWLVTQPEINPDQIILFGHSVGGGATWGLAQQRPTQGAIMLSTFASIRHIARDRFLPGFLAKDQFDNIGIVANYDRPIYFMHGTEDIVVKPYQADLLHAAAPNSELNWLPCGHGGCIGDITVFWDELEPRMRKMIND